MHEQCKVSSNNNLISQSTSDEKKQFRNNASFGKLEQTILDTISVFAGENCSLEIFYNDKGEKHARFAKDFLKGNDSKCPFNMPVSFQDIAETPQNKERTPYEKRFPQLFAEAEQGYISDKTLQETALTQLKRIPYIFMKNEDNEMNVFEGRNLWTKRYNTLQKARIYAATEYFQKQYKYVAFVTLTYQYTKHGKHCIKACESFQKHSDKIIQAVRKRNPGGHICVNESTAKGYPHSHILFFSNTPFQENWDKLPCNKKLKFGGFIDFLKERVDSPVFDVKKPYNDKLVGYLTKYISKNSSADLTKIAQKEEKLSKTDRKELLTIILFQMAQKRRLRMSSSKEIAKILAEKKEEYIEKVKHEYSEKDSVYTIGETVKKEEVKKDFDLIKTFPTYEQIVEILGDSNRRQAFLIDICTKSALPCLSHTWISTAEEISPFFNDPNREKEFTHEEVEQFAKKNCRKVGCHGCLISHWLNLLRTGSDEWFMISNPKPKFQHEPAVEKALFNLRFEIALRQSQVAIKGCDWRVGLFFVTNDYQDKCDYKKVFCGYNPKQSETEKKTVEIANKVLEEYGERFARGDFNC